MKAHKTLPADQIDENFQRQKQLSKVDSLKIFFGQQAEKGGKKGRLVLPKRFKLQQVQQAVNSKFDDQIYDYAKDDVIGSRKDFAIFSYWMDSTTGKRFLYWFNLIYEPKHSFNDFRWADKRY